MNIYQIDRAILELVDAETGELLDYEAFEQLQMARDEKIDNVACWIKELAAECTALKTEENALAERRKEKEAKAESLKKYLTQALNGKPFESARCAVSFRKSEAVEITNDALVPRGYQVETITYRPDKKKIKEAIKGGMEIEGCSLSEKQNVSVR